MLGRIGDPAGAPALRRALGLADDKARATAVDALRRVRDRDATPLVVPLLGDEDPEVRANVAQFLGDLGEPAHAEALRAALAKESSPATATRVACALSRLGDDMDARLKGDFVTGDQLERQAAAEELRRLNPAWPGDPLAPEELRRAAADGFRRR
jgi:HEAT repeat protein